MKWHWNGCSEVMCLTDRLQSHCQSTDIIKKTFSYIKPHYNAVIDLLRERIMGGTTRCVSPIQVLS